LLIIINWEAFFILAFDSSPALAKTEDFDDQTCFWSLFFWPVALSGLVTWFTPFLHLFFVRFAKYPTVRRNSHNLGIESERLGEEFDLLQKRNANQGVVEDEIIRQATVDAKASEFKDAALKKRVQEDLEISRINDSHYTVEDQHILRQMDHAIASFEDELAESFLNSRSLVDGSEAYLNEIEKRQRIMEHVTILYKDRSNLLSPENIS